ncbi:sugar phosphate nucleotidyltransferase [Alphaproteobacteria bacterium]|nr:sugar phosphate nucleotidyltransferase [Alphaproteobacteria bacterium]
MNDSVKLDRVLLRPDTPILDAMKILNAQSHGQQFLVVVDERSCLLGTLTDGDIRRALLSGRSLEGTVNDFMCHDPVFARSDENTESVDKLLASVSSANPFLPIVDQNMVVNSIKIKGDLHQRELNALVLAGGFGKRLGERTKSCPKSLLHVDGKPMLEHVLTRLEGIGVSKIFVAVHYLSEQIEEFLVETNREKHTHVLHESKPLGTAGAIGLLPQLGDCDLIVSNSDVLTKMDYGVLLKYHQQLRFDATVAVADHRVQIPFGVVRHDLEGNFLCVEEKPTLSHYVAAGVYCLRSTFINSVSRNEYVDMPHLLDRGNKKGLSVGVFPMHEEWCDIGRPEDFDTANKS